MSKKRHIQRPFTPVAPTQTETTAPLRIEHSTTWASKRIAEALSAQVPIEHSAKTVVHIGNPVDWKPLVGRRNIGIASWPYSAMPEAAIRGFYGIDLLVVPSEWCARGVIFPTPHQKLAIVPFGVDGELFASIKRERGNVLRFMAFDSDAASHQAGCDMTIAAFKAAFPGRDDVLLDIWTSRPIDLPTLDPRIQIRRVGDDRNLVAAYHRYDAFLCGARGSGFGFIPLEAMATGMPVLHSGQGAFEAFSDIGVLLGSRRMTVPKPFHSSAVCHEPLLDLYGARLLQLDASYERFAARAVEDAQTVRERFPWARFVQGLLDAMEGRNVSDQPGDLSERRAVPGAA